MNPEALAGEAGGPPCRGSVIENFDFGVNPVRAALEVCEIGAATDSRIVRLHPG